MNARSRNRRESISSEHVLQIVCFVALKVWDRGTHAWKLYRRSAHAAEVQLLRLGDGLQMVRSWRGAET